MNRIRRRSAGIISVACLGIALAACSGQAGSEVTGQSVDPLLGGWGGGGGLSPCAQCIESSCSTQLSALEAELKALHSATQAAYACVEQNHCLGLFWEDQDSGFAAAHNAVQACIAACDADAGLPGPDAGESEVQILAQSLEGCVETSCAATCPGAGGGFHGANEDSGTVSEDGAVVSEDGGVVSDDAGNNGTGNGNGTGPGNDDSGAGSTGASDCGAGGGGGGGSGGWGGFRW
jgi:hypothetical protein